MSRCKLYETVVTCPHCGAADTQSILANVRTLVGHCICYNKKCQRMFRVNLADLEMFQPDVSVEQVVQ